MNAIICSSSLHLAEDVGRSCALLLRQLYVVLLQLCYFVDAFLLLGLVVLDEVVGLAELCLDEIQPAGDGLLGLLERLWDEYRPGELIDLGIQMLWLGLPSSKRSISFFTIQFSFCCSVRLVRSLVNCWWALCRSLKILTSCSICYSSFDAQVIINKSGQSAVTDLLRYGGFGNDNKEMGEQVGQWAAMFESKREEYNGKKEMRLQHIRNAKVDLANFGDWVKGIITQALTIGREAKNNHLRDVKQLTDKALDDLLDAIKEIESQDQELQNQVLKIQSDIERLKSIRKVVRQTFFPKP